MLVPACSKDLKSGIAVIEEEGQADLIPGDKGDQWLGHLGSHRNGRTSDVNWQQNWLDHEPEMLWQNEIGNGVAGVAIANERVFAVGNVDGFDKIYCFNIDDGAEDWSFSYECPLGKRMFEGGPAATPSIDPVNGRVYVLSHQGELRCLDVNNGVELWMIHYVRDLGGSRPQYGFAGAPLLVGSVLIVQPGGDGSAVVALDPESGEKKWGSGSDGPSYSAPISFEYEGRHMLASFNSYGLVVYGLSGGDEMARMRWKTNYEINAATPCYFAGHVFIASGYGKGAGLVALNDSGGELIYETKEVVCQFQSPVRSGRFMYVVSGDNSTKARLCCVRFDNGEVQWSEPLGGNRGNVIISGDKLVVITEKGEALLCDASPDGFVDRGRFQALNKRCWAPPTIATGKLFVRNNSGRLACYGLR
ncbi:MAG: PQQ-binding-like beta-propeller repeat protein [Verrucomicrobiaceae bacterium]|nr:PQQ-binding-like beta-propeller repeat protein [Verrucomicrobiaceae bacterium]